MCVRECVRACLCVCTAVLRMRVVFSNQSYLIQKSYLVEIKLRVFTQPFFQIQNGKRFNFYRFNLIIFFCKHTLKQQLHFGVPFHIYI